jgi:uncharacterized protein YpmB
MKNNNVILIVATVVILIILGGAGYYGYTVIQEREQAKQMAEEKAKAEAEAAAQQKAEEDALLARTKCVNTDKYSIVTLDHADSAVGQDIVVKPTTDSQDCKYVVNDGDFEIKSADPEYYKFQAANALVTDIGTGPTGRSIRLYDLGEKKLITEKKYFGELTLASSTLKYMGEAKTKIKSCKGDTVVEKDVDLTTFMVKEGKTSKCVEAQQ